MRIQDFLREISDDTAILTCNKPISASCSGSRHFNGIFATEGIFWDQLPGGTVFLSPNGSTWTFFQQLLRGVSFKHIKSEYVLLY